MTTQSITNWYAEGLPAMRAWQAMSYLISCNEPVPRELVWNLDPESRKPEWPESCDLPSEQSYPARQMELA